MKSLWLKTVQVYFLLPQYFGSVLNLGRLPHGQPGTQIPLLLWLFSALGSWKLCIQSGCEKRKRGNCASRFSTHIPLAKAQSLGHTGLYGILRFAVSAWEEEKIGLLIS